jgi:hypothetical protein
MSGSVVVVAGKNGFIGRLLSAALAAHGVEAVDIRDFLASPGRADLLVNLANIAEDPAANIGLLNDRLLAVGHRVERWLQVQSFITLHGKGSLRLGSFNAGFTPLEIDEYGAGKLGQERRLLDAVAHGEVKSVTFSYLPAVLDAGGSWARARAQATASGYILPRRMSPDARANFLYVADFAEDILSVLVQDTRDIVERRIVNDPLSRTTTWHDLLGSRQLSYQAGGPRAVVAREARHIRARLRARHAALDVRRRSARIPPSQPAPPSDRTTPAVPSEPLEFRGALSAVVRHQGFLPSG